MKDWKKLKNNILIKTCFQKEKFEKRHFSLMPGPRTPNTVSNYSYRLASKWMSYLGMWIFVVVFFASFSFSALHPFTIIDGYMPEVGGWVDNCDRVMWKPNCRLYFRSGFIVWSHKSRQTVIMHTWLPSACSSHMYRSRLATSSSRSSATFILAVLNLENVFVWNAV